MDNPESPIEPIEPDLAAEPAHIRRPTSVTLLIVGVLILTILNLLRLILSILNWGFLASWPGVSPFYTAITGLIWCVAGAMCCWGLWGAMPWAPRMTQAVALTYALYYWLDHLFLVAHPASSAEGSAKALLPVNWPFALGVTVVSLAYVAWVFRRPKVIAYFWQAEVSQNHDAPVGNSG